MQTAWIHFKNVWFRDQRNSLPMKHFNWLFDSNVEIVLDGRNPKISSPSVFIKSNLNTNILFQKISK